MIAKNGNKNSYPKKRMSTWRVKSVYFSGYIWQFLTYIHMSVFNMRRKSTHTHTHCVSHALIFISFRQSDTESCPIVPYRTNDKRVENPLMAERTNDVAIWKHRLAIDNPMLTPPDNNRQSDTFNFPFDLYIYTILTSVAQNAQNAHNHSSKWVERDADVNCEYGFMIRCG